MALERKILSITKPTILLDQMDMVDTSAPNAAMKSTENEFKKAGFLYPLVGINKYQFDASEVTRFRLDFTGFMPEVSINVVSGNGIFLSKNFPKDGDPVSIFIRSKMDEFKPIRADFEITSINSAPSFDNTGEVIQFTIDGILRIPGIFADHCKAFSDKTSFDTLQAVANDLTIGFASNETLTSDQMKWLCPFDSYHKFIKDVTAASYKNDDSFFGAFIDCHYFLNFININNQFSDDYEDIDALDSFSENTDFYNDQSITKFNTKLVLCNHKNFMGSSNYIEKYTLLGNSGQVVIENGYRRYTQFYDNFFKADLPKDKYQSFFVESLNTDGVRDKILNKGRIKEDFYNNTNKYKWLGNQMSLPKGNAHENHIYARVHNWQNIQDLEKMMLYVVLSKPNFNIYRGQRIPVVIINMGNTMRQKSTQDEGASAEDRISRDKFLTGYYMVHGIKYYWDAIGGFKQELLLTRREWPIPSQTPDNIATG